MEDVVLNVEKRTLVGKKAKRLYAEKKIPGVFYLGNENVTLQADEAPIRTLVGSHTTHVIKVKFEDGSERRAILSEVQFDPIVGKVVHFDLHGIREGEKITVEIPVRLVGSAKGIKDGGVLQHSVHRIRIQCEPDNVPEHVMVEVAELGIGDSVHVKDLKLEGVKILDNLESAIVTIVPPPSLKEETPEAAALAAAEGPAEPEVIGKSKKTEEGAEGAAEEKGKK